MAKKKKGDDEDEEKGGGLPIKKVAIAAVVGIVVYTQFLSGGGGEAEAMGPTTTAAPVEGMVLEAGQIRVTLADEDPHFAMVSFGVVLDESVMDTTTIEGKLPLLLDAAVDEIAGFNAEQLKGSRGPERIRTALDARVEEMFHVEDEPIEVIRVVVTELIVQ